MTLSLGAAESTETFSASMPSCLSASSTSCTSAPVNSVRTTYAGLSSADLPSLERSTMVCLGVIGAPGEGMVATTESLGWADSTSTVLTS